MSQFKSLRSWVGAAGLLVGSLALAADPSLHEVYQAADAGQLGRAQEMMTQVLRDHPDSAKAHFVEAELLVKEGRTDQARKELATAERLAPGLPFAKPESVSSLRQHLSLGSPAAMGVGASPNGASSWSPLLLGLIVLLAVMFLVRRMFRPPTPMPLAQPGYGAPGYGQGYPAGMGPGPMAPMGGGMGSGILGGLATGAAVGAGVVAGEALMHRVLDGGASHEGGLISNAGAATGEPGYSDPGYDVGGQDFGVTDSGSWDSAAPGDAGSDDW